MSIIQEGNPQYVRMAHLAAIGSHKVNGVAGESNVRHMVVT